MAKTNKSRKNMSPIVKIALIDYEPAKQNEYSKNFMSPLIKGLLQRMQLAKTE